MKTRVSTLGRRRHHCDLSAGKPLPSQSRISSRGYTGTQPRTTTISAGTPSSLTLESRKGQEKIHPASASTSNTSDQTRKRKELLRKTRENPEDMEALDEYLELVKSSWKRRKIDLVKNDPDKARRRGISWAEVQTSSSSEDETVPQSPLESAKAAQKICQNLRRSAKQC